ncbi:hypothetical protein GPALN_011067 [Globodera pallida]|uniref:Golgi SNAP receptor complex member 1 n=1 Tax=Globodera pallida TaxID=36090 RepID=A0A183BRW3_GLOPA|nr:hypothetical protein GPALN_011067 [Globodera pallida]
MVLSSALDDLQRKARLLENEIDAQLISLNKFNASNGLPYNAHQTKAQSKRAVFDSLTNDIENKLSKLGEINDAMRESFENDVAEFSRTSAQHIVRRHRDILRDYNTEFIRTCSNIGNQLQREELMEVETESSVNNRCKPTDYLLREHESISSCDRLLNEQISIAMSVKENLYSQSTGLGSLGKRLHHLTKKYPAINHLMNKIRMKKRKDTLIVAAVISTCLMLMFLYIMH